MGMESVAVPDTAACNHCGYALRDLPKPTCPECGRDFDPSDPASFVDLATWRFWHRWASPPRDWHLIAMVTISAVGLLSATAPERSFACLLMGRFIPALPPPVQLTAGFLFVAPMADYAVRTGAALLKRAARGAHTPAAPDPRRWRWLVTPLCVVLVVAATLTDWPMRVRFLVSLPAFQAAATRSLGRTPRWTGPQRIGLYRIEGIMSDAPGAVYFKTIGRPRYPRTFVGFVFRPQNAPSAFRRSRLLSRWYAENW